MYACMRMSICDFYVVCCNACASAFCEYVFSENVSYVLIGLETKRCCDLKSIGVHVCVRDRGVCVCVCVCVCVRDRGMCVLRTWR
jgi:hypothetical protein